MVRGIVWVVVALLFAYAAFELYRGLRGGAAGAGHVPRDNDADFAASEDELNRFVIERAYADRADANAGDDGANDTSPWNEARSNRRWRSSSCDVKLHSCRRRWPVSGVKWTKSWTKSAR
jgi:hypothetical protein